MEEQTGQDLAPGRALHAGNDRHLSVRLPGDVFARLEQVAAERQLRLSKLVRDVLLDAARARGATGSLSDQELVSRLSADVDEVKRRLAS